VQVRWSADARGPEKPEKHRCEPALSNREGKEEKMTKEDLDRLFSDNETNEIGWEGECHDCGKNTTVLAAVDESGLLSVSGGAVYGKGDLVWIKCEACFEKDEKLHNFQPCEVYSRVVGYLRPVNQWNPGKQAEYKNRHNFDSTWTS